VVFPIARRRALVPPCSVPRSRRQDASNPFLQPTFTSRAPAGNTFFGDCPSSAVGNPPTFDFETALCSRAFAWLRTAPDHLAVIRPPTATRLTACPLASGLSTTSKGKRQGVVCPRCLCRLEPSDTSHRRLDKDPRFLTARLCSIRLTPLPLEHVNAPTSTESRCLPSRETCTGALSSLGLALCPGWPARTGAARVHRGLVTSTRPLFVRFSRAPSRPRALSRLLQPMFPRARPRTPSNIPNDRKPSLGRLPFSSKVAFRRGQPPKLREVRDRGTPCLGTPHRDCSRWRLCPDLDRFGHLLSRGPFFSLSGATWENSGTASATHPCTECAASGSCGAPPPRRGETFTNPRGLSSTGHPHRGRVVQ
jgi:hypothetical protein